MIGITIEHRQIINWTERRGGNPAIDKSVATPCPIIRFANDDHHAPWEEWMSIFDGGEWAFVYEDRTSNGELSKSCKTIPRFGELG